MTLLRYGGSISPYVTADPRPDVPFWELVVKGVTVHFLSNYVFPESPNQRATPDLPAALAVGDLRYDVRATYP
ncbi:hypothetical protein [Promicromonospora sp. NPDC060271]|uniref:hypothetical protein n=1 Tax=Promicromonospora sp. NPDC060271 TaxID=3347089 RepID=UPI003651ABF0